MRLVIVAAIAHGCSANGDCTLDKWTMPAQTLEGYGTMTMHSSGGKLGNTTVPPTTQSTEMNISQSFDYEDMNMVQRISQNMVQGSMDSDMILHWKAGLITTHVKTAFPKGEVHDQCTTVKLPLFLRFLPVGKVIEKIKDMEAGLYKCVGHHDNLDKFGLRMEFPPKWLPKVLTAKSAHVNVTTDIDVDAAGLLKSLKLEEGVSMDVRTTVAGKQETMHTESRILQDMTVSKSRPGGPRPWDLRVPAKWGNCSTVHMPELNDLLAEWERSDSPFFGHTRIIPHILRTMMAEAKASTVVV